jgi:hypothetical protein
MPRLQPPDTGARNRFLGAVFIVFSHSRPPIQKLSSAVLYTWNSQCAGDSGQAQWLGFFLCELAGAFTQCTGVVRYSKTSPPSLQNFGSDYRTSN